MDDAGAVRRGERRQDRAPQLAGFLDRQRSAILEPVGERFALEVLHDQERFAFVARPQIGDLGDALVADLRRGDRLAVKPLQHRRGAEVRVQDLDRDPLAELGVGPEIDRAHPAGREQALDPILVVEHRAARQGPGPRTVHSVEHKPRNVWIHLEIAVPCEVVALCREPDLA
jgi:hypothetical protein